MEYGQVFFVIGSTFQNRLPMTPETLVGTVMSKESDVLQGIRDTYPQTNAQTRPQYVDESVIALTDRQAGKFHQSGNFSVDRFENYRTMKGLAGVQPPTRPE